MLTVTEAARARLAQMLEQQGVPRETSVRLVHERDGIALQGDEERPGDETFQHRGRTVLALDTQISEFRSASTLDIDGAKFTLRHPEADA